MLKNRTNILSAKIKKPVKKTPVNQSELKQAYGLVSKDLFKALKRLKDNGSIKFGDCGTFHKKLTRLHSALDDTTYRYYRISFKISNTLKKELDK